MAQETTSTLSNSIRARYHNMYIQGARQMMVYDQIASAEGHDLSKAAEGSSYVVPFASHLSPATSVISQIADLTPVTRRDATVTITPTSRANAVQVAEVVKYQAYTDYEAELFRTIGENMSESVDLVAQGVALQGGFLLRAAARASLDAGTAGHLLSDDTFFDAENLMLNAKVPYMVDANGERIPSGLICILHPWAYKDLLTGGNVVSIAQYQDAPILLQHELGQLGSFRLVVTPFAKAFFSAGAANGSAIGTTIDADANALAQTISVASATNIDVGDRITIGTLETGDTHYATNENVLVSSVSGTDIGIIGSGPNGGLRYDHASGQTVSNADTVCPVLFAGPRSLAKIYHQDQAVGEYGTIVSKTQGLVDQFNSLGWKWYGGYGEVSPAWYLRAEVATSMDA